MKLRNILASPYNVGLRAENYGVIEAFEVGMLGVIGLFFVPRWNGVVGDNVAQQSSRVFVQGAVFANLFANRFLA